tara:strand:+ start:346 stop:615 length:270 start_codon:yes stop_codon:yes gene_type:complete
MRSYIQGIFTGMAISVSVFLLMGAQKNRSNTILEMIIEDQKDDLRIKAKVIDNQSAIKKNQIMIEQKFRNIYRYLGENCPCFDNLSDDF